MLAKNTSVIEYTLAIGIIIIFDSLIEVESLLTKEAKGVIFTFIFAITLITFEFDLYTKYPTSPEDDLEEIKENFTQEVNWNVSRIRKNEAFYNYFKDELVIPKKIKADYYMGNISEEDLVDSIAQEIGKSKMRKLMITSTIMIAVSTSSVVSIIIVSESLWYIGVGIVIGIGVHFFEKYIDIYVKNSTEDYVNELTN